MPKEVFSFDQLKKEIIAYRASIPKEKNYTSKWANTNIGEKKAEYFMFNPNDLSVEKWKKLGLHERQIKVIKNYESKGGRFYKKEDLKKIYSISQTDYQTLEPFIQIPEEQSLKSRSSTNSHPREEKVRKEVVIVEINTADSVQLEMLRGIGPAFASRIIRYRSRLGGFYMKEQLKEVFGLDSAKFEEIKDHVIIDPSLIRKININTANFEDMKRHPYLTYNQMNAIIQYRRRHGNYNNISDIRKIAIINEENFRKIEPYLNL